MEPVTGVRFLKKHRCYHCERVINTLSPYYAVRKATKPKGTPHRFKVVGSCCEECFDNKKEITYD